VIGIEDDCCRVELARETFEEFDKLKLSEDDLGVNLGPFDPLKPPDVIRLRDGAKDAFEDD